MQRIMIVDDEALVLFDLTMTVEDLGYQVFCDCISVDDALQCLGDDCPDAALHMTVCSAVFRCGTRIYPYRILPVAGHTELGFKLSGPGGLD